MLQRKKINTHIAFKILSSKAAFIVKLQELINIVLRFCYSVIKAMCFLKGFILGTNCWLTNIYINTSRI